jgi:phytoene synthase
MQAEHSWERSLLSLAYEGRHAVTQSHDMAVDHALLETAYSYCETMTALNSRSFHMASSLLPAEKRRAVRALYAFCRVTDDLVDRAEGNAGRIALEEWRRRLIGQTPPGDDLVAVAWSDARQRHRVPWRYAEQLIDGVARDLEQTRYQTFDDLAAYSYGVASTVGLMSMHIIGYQGPEAIPYAIKLGVALQMTNILRDVAEDWQRGRIYLPQEDMEHFGVTEADIAEGRVTAAWRQLMAFQIERTRRLYDEAAPGIYLLDRDGRFAIAAAADLYRGILTDIERHEYDVFGRRAFVTIWGKLRMLPAIWWKSRRGPQP